MKNKLIRFAVLGLLGIGLTTGVAYRSNQAIAQQTNTIAQTASQTSDLSTLLAAVKAAGLADTLGGDGPFTVLAPTNDAFEKLPHGVLQQLLEPKNKEILATILKYHVISGNLDSNAVIQANGQKVPTVEGGSIRIKVKGSNIFINRRSRVTQADIQAKNGVIHTIDQVLIPPQFLHH